MENQIFEIYHQNDLVAIARNISTIKKYFRISNAHKHKDLIINKAVRSEKYNITIIIKQTIQQWQNKSSIVFKKNLALPE